VTDQPPTTVPPHRLAGYEAVYEVIRSVPGDVYRNALIWRAVEAYRTASEAEHERQVLAEVTDQAHTAARWLDSNGQRHDANAVRWFAGAWLARTAEDPEETR
jgi:hypothetical protein